jgi:general secretion pathway protein H
MRGDVSAGRAAGFTLIEVLVALLIMGLLVGLVSAIVRPDDRGLLRIEAERLGQLLDLAASESRFTGERIAWTADSTGYRFWRTNGDAGWSEMHDSDLLRARSLPQGMTIAGLQVENMRSHGAMRVELAPYGPAPLYIIELSLGSVRYAVTASPLGDVRVVPREGSASDG